MNAVSTNYRELSPDEAQRVATECAQAWTDPRIPERQYEIVKPELEGFRNRRACPPFDALARCLHHLPSNFVCSQSSLLDVGASGGYYREVLQIAGYNFIYTGLDFSFAFKALAEKLYPGIRFDVADARALPYADDSFDVVLSGCCLLHILDYEAVIRETARVASRYAIFSKTPVLRSGPTRFYEKEAYGVRTLEIHFAEEEFLQLCAKHGLGLIWQEDVYPYTESALTHRTYLMKKHSGIEPYASIKTV